MTSWQHSSKSHPHNNTANPIAAAPTKAPAVAMGLPAAPLPAAPAAPLSIALAAPAALLDPSSNTLLASALALTSTELELPVTLFVLVPLSTVLAAESIELVDAAAAEVMLPVSVEAALMEDAKALREERPDCATPVPTEAESRLFWARVAAGATRRMVAWNFILI